MLARAGVIGWPAQARGALSPAAWLIAGYMGLNTLGNLASGSRIERTLFAAVTAILAVLCAYLALGRPFHGVSPCVGARFGMPAEYPAVTFIEWDPRGLVGDP